VPAPALRSGALHSGLVEACLRVPGIEAAIASLADPDVLVVTTGQQPALFTGPLYTVHKALSAAALAEVLGRRWGRKVVPVFWVAGDDHDFTEANHASWLNSEGALVTGSLRERPPDAPLLPLYREQLGSEIDGVLAQLEADLPPAEHRDSTLDWLRRHFRPDRTVAGAYGSALAELLAPFGVVCLDSTHAAVKRAAGPLLLEALRKATDIERLLDERSGDLMGQGTDPGVAAADGATLVMVEAALGRDRLVRSDGGFVTRRAHERFGLADLERLARQEPQRLSPNVLLRPVVESALLPTVAYVAGPGELRYLPLCRPLYESLGVVPQLPVPRWSGILVEHRVDRVLEKFSATLDELLQSGRALESRVIRSQLPSEAIATLERLRGELSTGYDTLASVARAIDPTIEKTIQNAGKQAQSGTQEVEKKLVQHLRKRSEVEMSQVERARTAVLPGGRPQERVLTVAPFLSRYGPELLQQLKQEMVTWYTSALEGASQSS
jgi:bacillithiol biosynthesis cysteine-adding enzyme BshC